MQSAKVVSVTQPLIKGLSPEDFICYAARVSNPANQNNTETNERLLKYLMKNKHWSPFEMVSVCVEVKTRRDIARQLLRHRSLSFQEFSQRYAEVSDDFVFSAARLQDSKNRQNSIAENVPTELTEWWKFVQTATEHNAKTFYDAAIKMGIAKEVARTILPEGMTPSTLYVNGTLRSWIHYCDLRMANGTQLEHMELARLCWTEISKHFPTIGALIDTKEL
jgi:thymidylate synthase (FAD)